MLDIFGVDQPHLEALRFEQIERRLPIIAGCLHHHPGDGELTQPVSHHQQRPGHRRMRAHLLPPPTPGTITRHPHTTDQFGLADIQRRDPLDDLLVVVRLLQHQTSYSPAIPKASATRRSCQGRCESNPRARSNNEGPINAAPSVRLDDGLQRTKQRRRQRVTDTPFSARNGPPARAK
jgi:hypothetical protein